MKNKSLGSRKENLLIAFTVLFVIVVVVFIIIFIIKWNKDSDFSKHYPYDDHTVVLEEIDATVSLSYWEFLANNGVEVYYTDNDGEKTLLGALKVQQDFDFQGHEYVIESKNNRTIVIKWRSMDERAPEWKTQKFSIP